MFVRKLYYDPDTGDVLESHMRQGDVRMTTFAEDCAALPSLAGRSEADTGCMLWTEPDATTEACFVNAVCVGVNIGQNPPSLIWEYNADDAGVDETL